ncbi:hypothetical protein EDB89DRAFT_347779 [Lactarius sanguifluus]|nr:hypothetical protein EDB89DRAFT_347779 [Lactarius sanguifluus]
MLTPRSHIPQMIHTQPSPLPGLAVVNEITPGLSRPSTYESTSTVTLVRPSYQDQRPRSTSRGRGRQYQSSGIGGAGNIRASSTSSERAHIVDGPDDFSSTRGREPRSPFHPDKIISIGRGGAGNIRSPSRDVDLARPSKLSSILETEQTKYERSVIRDRETAREGQLVCPPCLVTCVARSKNVHPSQHSGGRGGVGNMVRRGSQSRSLSRSTPRGLEASTNPQPDNGTNGLASRGAHTHQRAASREELSRRKAL